MKKLLFFLVVASLIGGGLYFKRYLANKERNHITISPDELVDMIDKDENYIAGIFYEKNFKRSISKNYIKFHHYIGSKSETIYFVETIPFTIFYTTDDKHLAEHLFLRVKESGGKEFSPNDTLKYLKAFKYNNCAFVYYDYLIENEGYTAKISLLNPPAIGNLIDPDSTNLKANTSKILDSSNIAPRENILKDADKKYQGKEKSTTFKEEDYDEIKPVKQKSVEKKVNSLGVDITCLFSFTGGLYFDAKGSYFLRLTKNVNGLFDFEGMIKASDVPQIERKKSDDNVIFIPSGSIHGKAQLSDDGLSIISGNMKGQLLMLNDCKTVVAQFDNNIIYTFTK